MPRKEKSTKTIQVRVEPSWLRGLDAAVAALKPDEESSALKRSGFIRDAAGFESMLWRKSPYVCTRALHFFAVGRTGDFHYLRDERLRLNKDLNTLPANLFMKDEKRQDFRERYNTGEDIRKLWLFHNFSVSDLWDDRQEILQESTDEKGTISKAVHLPVNVSRGSALMRESIAVVRDYVQYASESPAARHSHYDRADILVDVPTRDLEIVVAVDEELYSAMGPSRPTGMRFELRNREGVSFEGIVEDLDERFLRRIGNRFPPVSEGDAFYDESITRVSQLYEDFGSRVEQISRRRGESPPANLASFRAPQRYMFYRLLWRWAHSGIIVSVKWLKPRRK